MLHMRAVSGFLKTVLAGCAVAGLAAAAEPSGFAREGTEQSFEAIQRMSEADLKDFYLGCARASVRQRLGHGEIALCSFGYERLLQGTFGGDFVALLEWRRGARRTGDEGPAAEPR